MTQLEERPAADPELVRLREIAETTPARQSGKAAPRPATPSQPGAPTAAVADASETYWAQIQAKAEAAQARINQPR